MNRLIIRAIEPYAEAMAHATKEDCAEAMRRYSGEVRRAEWLTWRNVVRQCLGDVTISYDALGAPVVLGTPQPIYISVSHCRSHIAVALSDAPCGVDIEWRKRDFERSASRFLSLGERMMEFNYPDLMAGAAWCAKEAAYKYYCSLGRQYPDLLRDLRIEECNLTAGRMRIVGGEGPAVNVALRWANELIIATIGVEMVQTGLHSAQTTDLEEE
ncbi:MAG: 4'-phosphopantetheinyl transferase superfamily protein [Rikenellaceae bacterium]|nr:4'-phosphopantetheinyl transferase superfamily protein [Rikenellaceae bacterium]